MYILDVMSTFWNNCFTLYLNLVKIVEAQLNGIINIWYCSGGKEELHFKNDELS